ncbi:hypothetical protein BCR32DRAFT_251535 [Anaeromyces robustus]|uniref:LIM zinc-binding domain-containing protein n=1 Tax=Anaeromyces robustus TaxID=1754192 RepID=A0A1Y1VQF5_9FUNG|nr:hypothetical protein BCR32DRAFT_251535 [Anaeromyces robustus]|eukprot:ORX63542.1 hypothetical protein BCR32DRAFT_251535 [Anaeromyces robustus]
MKKKKVIDRSNTDISDISKHVSKAIFNLPEIIPVNHHISQLSSFNRSPSATSINSHSQEDSEFFKRFRQLEEESIMNGINNGYNFSHESLNSDTEKNITSKNSSIMSLPKISSPLVTQDEAILQLEAIVNSSFDGINDSSNGSDDFLKSKLEDSKNSVNNSTELGLEDYTRKGSLDDDQAYMIKTPTSHRATSDINEITLDNFIISENPKREENSISNNLNKNVSKRKTQIFSMDNYISKRKNSAVRQSLINPKFENTNNVVKCSGCNTEIGNSDYIEALNSVWHTYCFKCKKCGKVLEDTFYEVDNEPYCEQHYVEDDNLYCAECKQLIVDTYIDFEGKYYHEDHFVCSKCKTTLSGKQCYIMELDDGNGNTMQEVYCEECSQAQEE